ncbi:protein phosphatase 1 regulatory subunit 26 isoform X1 [Electrophorus electricus]|uniref:protein phosphatase 1 regulatory subunit 26 isoform X1 n=1 Tax=Electrophorus electricus TaxID=8005 RepID=UPI0015D067F3|nr:protein phosphatase 1 regulatory subunit 26 isoform X1 [Electrophorus electricus]XP_035377526.1 protein phosphatase 1 regulatory subunit 26 isoform X1 [Electrophorus electricus]XP_035377528.1 protein phosphatase 1 regulatory subunit 26 isoform X1 [Electrophorus electricus]
MFLKTVPPVVAVHSEWRPAKSFSLPLCFNESTSDSDSAGGTPIPHKVQMIIDSLRSTQSSDMSDGPRVSLDLPRSAGRRVKPCCPEAPASPRRPEADGGKLQAAELEASRSSDSDDSVDRGIEEAIQEYLKEKVDHKRNVDAPTSPVRGPKVQRMDPGIPDPSKEVAQSVPAKVLTASNHVQKGSRADQPLAASKIKKRPSKENPVQRAFPAKPSSDQMLPPLRIKEEEVPDSSSDDGIEEAIQRFQQEQRDHHEGPRRPKEAPDSSSDDGIEEAIWHYQREKRKEKSRRLLPKPRGKVSAPPAGPAAVQQFRKLPKKKTVKKSAAAEREVTHASPVGSAASHPLDAGSGGRDGAEDPRAELQARPALSINTTAELMCAEAILDISKTVMPAAFQPDPSGPAGTPAHFLACHPPQGAGRSDDSSVDSEDGIEQEIQKFLELKAKMHEQLPMLATGPPACAGTPAAARAPLKKKGEEDRSKMLRLSLSRKRKHKEENGRGERRETARYVFKEEPQPNPIGQDSSSTETSRTHSPIAVKHFKPKQNSPGSVNKEKGSGCGPASPPNTPRTLAGSERNHSSDKSSSLDSDEDLDAAIKDLLKTKRKVKKKARDVKFKARRSAKGTETPETSKKPKPAAEQKSVPPSKPGKPDREPANPTGRDRGAKARGLKPQRAAKKPRAPAQGAEAEQAKSEAAHQPPAAAESSSVDSDDSIEQEIRKFLAEKAKGSGAPAVAADGKEVTERGVKVEEQQTWVTPGHAEAGGGQAPSSGCAAGTLEEVRGSGADAGKEGLPVPEAPRVGAAAEPGQKEAQHQNLFLMKPENCSMGDIRDSPSAPLEVADLPSSLQNRNRIPLREVISVVCPSPPPTARPSLGAPSHVYTAAGGDRLPSATLESRTDSLYLYSRIKREQWDQMPRLLPSSPHPPSTARHLPSSAGLRFPHLPTNLSHLSCVPLPPALSQPRLGAGVVRLRRDQAAGIPPPARRTHPLQLRNGQEEWEKERGEGRGAESDQEQKCVDETDVESGEERRSAQQRTDKIQQPSSHRSLSTCIDPGELLSPYIALDTEQRRLKFRHIQQGQRILKGVKRKLQFVVRIPK